MIECARYENRFPLWPCIGQKELFCETHPPDHVALRIE